jgi:hypothetical protein
MENEVSIEITINLSRVSAKLPLMALADVILQFSEGEITIRRCAIFEKSGEPPWASLPRISIEKNGRKNFVTLIELGLELRKRVLKALLDEYARHPR